MITIDGKEYFTWDEIRGILKYMKEHNITIEKSDEGIKLIQKKELGENKE